MDRDEPGRGGPDSDGSGRRGPDERALAAGTALIRASAGADTPEEDGDDLVDAVVEELGAIDAGDRQKTVSIWDGPLAAFAAVLEEGNDAEAARREFGDGLAQAFDLEDTPTEPPFSPWRSDLECARRSPSTTTPSARPFDGGPSAICDRDTADDGDRSDIHPGEGFTSV